MPRVERATYVTHGVTRNVDEAVARLRALAESEGVELVEADAQPEIAVVLGGDGTMLRALARFLDTGVPVIGANFGRVGFLAAIPGAELESGLARVFAGEFAVQALPTLEVEIAGTRQVAANDVVVVSNTPGRIVELAYSIGGEDLGTRPCDGLICATTVGSTAYNLSNGGPVLVWGLEAAVVTFVAAAHAAREAARRRARPRARGGQPHAGRGGRRARGRPPGRPARPRPRRHGALRQEPDDARNAA